MDLEKEVEKYKLGNSQAFDRIYNETKALVRFAIYSKIPNRFIIEDLIQDTYVKVNQMIFEYQAKNFRSWIYTIAKNTALDYLKKKKEASMKSLDILPDMKSSHPYLYYAIRHLEEIEREVFLMKVLCGHTTKKISEILNLKPSLVNQYYYLAKNKLKECLEEEEL
ncbi:MAG: sigma-70 family RNA polymerase sigma factor [Anaeroplasmataceae bacterium]|nr:sigma-70 family RNA polymerase sigma factor [Anaeroplasmataceae bacterium]MDE6414838.1 sigma-70 family RNA polymerase sigma factor [Anaeroplasmataceae bacterium]